MEYFNSKNYVILLILNINNIYIKIKNSIKNETYCKYVYCDELDKKYINLKKNILDNNIFIYENIFDNIIMIVDNETLIINKIKVKINQIDDMLNDLII
jgi:hypothetical protein